MDERRANTNSQDSPQPKLGGSHHFPLIIFSMPTHEASTQMSFCLRTPKWESQNSQNPKIGTLTTLDAHNFLCRPPMEMMSQPHFWKSARMTLTLPKWGLGSPLRLPKLQSLITGVKTPYLDAFVMSLESY